MIYCYYYLLQQFLLCSLSVSSETLSNQMFCSLTSVSRMVSNASTHADRMPYQMYPHADNSPSLPRDLVPCERNRPSNFQHTQSMTITDPAEQITTRAAWHAWFDQRRARLQTRLKQAEQAEWNWPCTRRRCEIMRIEHEIKQLGEEEFVVPF